MHYCSAGKSSLTCKEMYINLFGTILDLPQVEQLSNMIVKTCKCSWMTCGLRSLLLRGKRTQMYWEEEEGCEWRDSSYSYCLWIFCVFIFFLVKVTLTFLILIPIDDKINIKKYALWSINNIIIWWGFKG